MPWADDGMRHTSRAASPRDCVVAADGEQAGQLALGAGVGLQRHGVVAGDLRQPRLEVGDELAVALGLVERGERVERAELGPGDRRHLGGGVELHRAAAERDHRPVEGDVLVGQRPQVAEHLGLGAVGGEHRVGEVLAWCGPASAGYAGAVGSSPSSEAPNAARDPLEHVVGRWSRRARSPTVSASSRRRLSPWRSAAASDLVGAGRARARRACRRSPRSTSSARGARATRPATRRWRWTRSAMARRPSGPWYTAYIDAITASSTCAVQMFDVAFSRRMCCSRVCRARRWAGRPAASTDTPTRRPGIERRRSVAGGEEAGVGAAVAERHAEALRRADARRRRPARRAARAAVQASRSVATATRPPASCTAAMVGERSRTTPGGAGVLEQRAEARRRGRGRVEVADDELDADRLGPGRHDGDGLRVRLGVDEEGRRGVLGRAADERHGLGGRGGLVEHRRVGDVHAR